MVRSDPITTPITIRIDRSRTERPRDQLAMVDAEWDKLCGDNARYFNGSMLAFDTYDPNNGCIDARVEEYKHHAVRDTVNLGLSLLAVTGVFVAPDAQGQSRYLIGQRSPTTHRYGHLWEFGPCGGVDVPDSATHTLTMDAIIEELGREAMEEVGISMEGAEVSPIALVHDENVGSTDIVLRVSLPNIPPMRSGWEYEASRWVRHNELRTRMDADPEQFIPTAHEIMTLLQRACV